MRENESCRCEAYVYAYDSPPRLELAVHAEGEAADVVEAWLAAYGGEIESPELWVDCPGERDLNVEIDVSALPARRKPSRRAIEIRKGLEREFGGLTWEDAAEKARGRTYEENTAAAGCSRRRWAQAAREIRLEAATGPSGTSMPMRADLRPALLGATIFKLGRGGWAIRLRAAVPTQYELATFRRPISQSRPRNRICDENRSAVEGKSIEP